MPQNLGCLKGFGCRKLTFEDSYFSLRFGFSFASVKSTLLKWRDCAELPHRILTSTFSLVIQGCKHSCQAQFEELICEIYSPYSKPLNWTAEGAGLFGSRVVIAWHGCPLVDLARTLGGLRCIPNMTKVPLQGQHV